MPELAQPAAATSQGVVLTLAPILAVMGFVLVAPILARMQTYFRDVPNSDYWVPFVMTAPALCIAWLSPVAGFLADRLGARRLLMTSLLIYAFFGTAPVYLDSLPLILLSRVGVGIAEAGILTGTMTLVGIYYQGDARQKWLAYQAGAAPAAATVLLILGGLTGNGSWRFPFFAYALSLVVLVGVAMFTREPQIPDAVERSSERIPWNHLVKVGVFALFASLVFYIVPAELAFILSRQGIDSPGTIGLIIAIGTASVPVGTLLSRRLTSFPVGRVLAGSLAMMSAGLALISAAHALPAIALGIIVHQLGGGIMLPTAMNYALNGLGMQLQGRGTGAWWSVYFFGQFLTPVSVTLMTGALGTLSLALMVFAGLCLAFSIPVIFLTRAEQAIAH